MAINAETYTVYQYDPHGFKYIGPVVCFGLPGSLPPANSTDKQPEQKPGKWPFWNPQTGDWSYRDHYDNVFVWRKEDAAPVHVEDHYGPLPAEYTTVQPPEPSTDTFIQWNQATGQWDSIEDHRGQRGYIDGKPFTVAELGPLPEGFSTSIVSDAQFDRYSLLRTVIRKMKKKDEEKIRPLSEILLNPNGDHTFAESKLKTIDGDIEKMRIELAEVSGTTAALAAAEYEQLRNLVRATMAEAEEEEEAE
jgi:hypothetical protein